MAFHGHDDRRFFKELSQKMSCESDDPPQPVSLRLTGALSPRSPIWQAALHSAKRKMGHLLHVGLSRE